MVENLGFYLQIGEYAAAAILVLFASVAAPFYVPVEVKLPQSEATFGQEEHFGLLALLRACPCARETCKMHRNLDKRKSFEGVGKFDFSLNVTAHIPYKLGQCILYRVETCREVVVSFKVPRRVQCAVRLDGDILVLANEQCQRLQRVLESEHCAERVVAEAYAALRHRCQPCVGCHLHAEVGEVILLPVGTLVAVAHSGTRIPIALGGEHRVGSILEHVALAHLVFAESGALYKQLLGNVKVADALVGHALVLEREAQSILDALLLGEGNLQKMFLALYGQRGTLVQSLGNLEAGVQSECKLRRIFCGATNNVRHKE